MTPACMYIYLHPMLYHNYNRLFLKQKFFRIYNKLNFEGSIFVHFHLLALWINMQFNFEVFHFRRSDTLQKIRTPSKTTCYTVCGSRLGPWKICVLRLHSGISLQQLPYNKQPSFFIKCYIASFPTIYEALR